MHIVVFIIRTYLFCLSLFLGTYPPLLHIFTLSLFLSLSLFLTYPLSLSHTHIHDTLSLIYTNRTQVSLETLEKRAQRSASGSARTVVGLHSGVYNECVCANKPHTFVQL